MFFLARELEDTMSFKRIIVGFGVFFVLISCVSNTSIAHEWMAPKRIADAKNPIKMSSASIEKGKISYTQNCAVCHSNNLEGLPAEKVGLEMDSPNLKKRIRTHSDGDFFWKIQEGRGEMPSFMNDLSHEDTWHVINYIRASTD